MHDLEHATNAELLSSLTGKPAADALLARYGGLVGLAQASFDELREVPGIGESKAAAIKAAFLLSLRLTRESCPEMPVLDTPERVADLLREENRLRTVEELQVLLLNSRRRLLGVQIVMKGTLDSIPAHPREVFAAAISRRAAAVILAHNHPSGDPTPSLADIRTTHELIKAGRILRIEVLDHIIFGFRTDQRPRDYVSLRELGYFCL